MSEIYLLIIEDRHADVDVLPFSSEALARAALRRNVEENARNPEDIDWDAELTEGMRADGWVAYVPYSVEGDCVRIIKQTLDDS